MIIRLTVRTRKRISPSMAWPRRLPSGHGTPAVPGRSAEPSRRYFTRRSLPAAVRLRRTLAEATWMFDIRRSRRSRFGVRRALAAFTVVGRSFRIPSSAFRLAGTNPKCVASPPTHKYIRDVRYIDAPARAGTRWAAGSRNRNPARSRRPTAKAIK